MRVRLRQSPGMHSSSGHEIFLLLLISQQTNEIKVIKDAVFAFVILVGFFEGLKFLGQGGGGTCFLSYLPMPTPAIYVSSTSLLASVQFL